MIINPIAIATKGVYANSKAVSIASFGYIDLTLVGRGVYKGLYSGLYVDIYL